MEREAFKVNVVPLKQSIKSAELFFIYKTAKINQTMEVSIYASNCLPQNTQSHRLSSIFNNDKLARNQTN